MSVYASTQRFCQNFQKASQEILIIVNYYK